MLKNLEGYTTLIGNLIMGMVLVANLIFEAGISEEEKDGFVTAIVAIVTLIFNSINRFRTKGPVGKRTSPS